MNVHKHARQAGRALALWWGLCLLGAVWSPLLFAQEDAEFQIWFHTWQPTAHQTEWVSQARIEAAAGDPASVIDDIVELTAATGDEGAAPGADRRRRFREAAAYTLAWLDALRKTAADASEPKPAREIIGMWTLEVPRVLGDTYQLFAKFQGGGDRPDLVIRISGEDKSAEAKRLARGAVAIQAILSDIDDANRVDAVHRIRASLERWRKFRENVVGEQYPWETLINGCVLSTESEDEPVPPTGQFIIVRPFLAAVQPPEGESNLKPRLLVNVLGWRIYDAQTYRATWAVGGLYAPKYETDNEGVGLAVNYKRFSVGAVRYRRGRGRVEETRYFLGWEIAAGFSTGKSSQVDDAITRLKSKLP